MIAIDHAVTFGAPLNSGVMLLHQAKAFSVLVLAVTAATIDAVPAFSQTSATICRTQAYFDWEYAEPIQVFAQPEGEIKFLIQNDPITEEFVVLRLKRDISNYFLVQPIDHPTSAPGAGWIIKEHIRIGSRNYERPLILYTSPDTTSVAIVLTEYDQASVLEVVGCNAEWLQVSYVLGGRKHRAWMDPLMQCPSPYTTCP